MAVPLGSHAVPDNLLWAQSPAPHAPAGVPVQRWQKQRGTQALPWGSSHEKGPVHTASPQCSTRVLRPLTERDFLFEKEELIFNWKVVQFNVLLLLFIIIQKLQQQYYDSVIIGVEVGGDISYSECCSWSSDLKVK